ncbi:MAG: hypothetical protein A2538_00600 [Candidatus Magasanikbacteria bacterium RIFOXYD2_FULL_41_14]|uniref:Antitoxin n=1 Tax=Candidatus Magasanikbacteria bacterium RIFOXYD2_FULL_41_14 TaxID=1798709 RepID=A0A1F6PC36_9BACT|nr:MAG: hypothetical protein A2538_00600 [Candidatus Magasanikbacteria bacterium RIFOXYD2_FULL_41_14]
MNSSQFDRVMRILDRTGERCLVFDKSSDTGAMIMSLDEYEKFLNGGAGISDLSESDMLDKINRDISVWREKHQFENDSDNDFDWDFGQSAESDEPVGELVDEPVVEPINDNGMDFTAEPPIGEKPLDLAENEDSLGDLSVDNEIDLSQVPKDDEEEKFYLEPVE